MKKLILACLIVTLAAPGLQARKKKDQAGKVQDKVFTDNKYNFSISINEGWKYKIQLDKSNFRLVLTQKNFEVPTDYRNASEYTKVPRIVFYADTTSMGAMAFLDSLLSGTYASHQKKEILKEFEILNDQAIEEGTEREKTITKRRTTLSVGGQVGAIWQGKSNYRKPIPHPSDINKGMMVSAAYGGGIVIARKDNTVVLCHVICEFDYFDDIMKEMMEMITSITWGGEIPRKEEKS